MIWKTEAKEKQKSLGKKNHEDCSHWRVHAYEICGGGKSGGGLAGRGSPRFFRCQELWPNGLWVWCQFLTWLNLESFGGWASEQVCDVFSTLTDVRRQDHFLHKESWTVSVGRGGRVTCFHCCFLMWWVVRDTTFPRSTFCLKRSVLRSPWFAVVSAQDSLGVNFYHFLFLASRTSSSCHVPGAHGGGDVPHERYPPELGIL